MKISEHQVATLHEFAAFVGDEVHANAVHAGDEVGGMPVTFDNVAGRTPAEIAQFHAGTASRDGLVGIALLDHGRLAPYFTDPPVLDLGRASIQLDDPATRPFAMLPGTSGQALLGKPVILDRGSLA
jgi:hypothetical protein